MRAGAGLFYAGYGAILTPAFGVAAAYGDDTTQYHNALGFYLMRTFPAPAPPGPPGTDAVLWVPR